MDAFYTRFSHTSAFVVEVRTITTTLRCSLPKSFCNYFHNFISLYVKKLAKPLRITFCLPSKQGRI